MDTPLLSINIVSYNTESLTMECLKSIQRSIAKSWITQNPQEDIEVVIVDNFSKDCTVEAIEKLQKSFPCRIKLIKSQSNLGFGKGHNLASKESEGEILLLMNTDTLLMGDFLALLVSKFMQRNQPKLEKYKNLVKDESYGAKVHFLGPKLLNQDLTPQPSCGPYYSIPVIIGALFLKGDHLGFTRMSPNIDTQVDWISGACIMCKKSDFEEIHGFDEEIFMYMEEVEMLYRARRKGMTVWFTPTPQAIHVGSASSNKTYPITQVYKGFLYLYKKHHSALSLTMVQSILTLKSKVAIVLGKILRHHDLVDTYEESLTVLKDCKKLISPSL